MSSTRVGRSAIRAEVHTNWDDPWGSALANLGGVCDVLTYQGRPDLIPDSAGYGPGASGPDVVDYPAAEFLGLFEHEHVTADDLGYWARVLDRYADNVPDDRRY